MAAKIMDGLFICEAESSQDPEFLEQNKITFLINCAGKQIPNFYANHGRVYLKFDWDDNSGYTIFDSNGVILRQIVDFIESALVSGASVLAFSLRGVSRCVVCVIAYLMYKYRWGFEKTLAFVLVKHRDIRMNSGFITQLQDLDENLQMQRCKVVDMGLL
jgi:protein-tyrosine phosphatase